MNTNIDVKCKRGFADVNYEINDLVALIQSKMKTPIIVSEGNSEYITPQHLHVEIGSMIEAK